MQEDLIDFPCSSTWLDFYHERGLTPRSSGRMPKTELEILKNIQYLMDTLNSALIRIETLEKTLIKMLEKQNNHPTKHNNKYNSHSSQTDPNILRRD